MTAKYFTAESQRAQSCAEKNKEIFVFNSAYLCALGDSAVNDLLFERPIG